MDTKVISHVFGAVNSAERTLSKIEGLLPSEGLDEIRKNLPQQKDIVRRMRRVANLLQLESAKEDWDATTRSLRIFYGLHHMVRKDLISAHRQLRNDESSIEDEISIGQSPISSEATVLH